MESEERNDFGPGPTPALANCRIFPAPRAGFKRGQRSFAAGRVDGAVDVLQRRGDRLAVLIGGKLQGLCRKRWTMQVSLWSERRGDLALASWSRAGRGYLVIGRIPEERALELAQGLEKRV